MSLTVVGPGRLDSGRRGCPSTARGRKLRLPSLAGAAPVPRLQDASGRRPSNLDRDISSVGEFHQHVNQPRARGRDQTLEYRRGKFASTTSFAANSAQAAWLISTTGLDANNDIQT